MLELLPDSLFTWWWALWLVIGFGVPEAIALIRKRPGDTLSEHVIEWFATKPGAKGDLVKLRRFILLAAMAWLSVHWLSGMAWV